MSVRHREVVRRIEIKANRPFSMRPSQAEHKLVTFAPGAIVGIRRLWPRPGDGGVPAKYAVVDRLDYHECGATKVASLVEDGGVEPITRGAVKQLKAGGEGPVREHLAVQLLYVKGGVYVDCGHLIVYDG